jgi:hypothetical protein
MALRQFHAYGAAFLINAPHVKAFAHRGAGWNRHAAKNKAL